LGQERSVMREPCYIAVGAVQTIYSSGNKSH
jgi:hypothetical protein